MKVAVQDGLAWEDLDPVDRSALASFRWPCIPRNAPRKALYESIAGTIGTEGIGCVFGHGPDCFQGLGPWSIVPLSVLAPAVSSRIQSVYESSGMNATISSLTALLRGQVPVANPAGGPREVQGFDEDDEHTPVLASWPVKIPSPPEHEMITGAVQAMADRLHKREETSVDRIRFALWILLAWEGVPWPNLRKYNAFYGLDSFAIRADSKSLHFVAVMRQADLGLGIIPVTLRHYPELIQKLIKDLHAKQPGARLHDHRLRTTSERCKVRMPPNERSIVRYLREFFPRQHSIYREKWNVLAKALNRVSQLHAAYYCGGMLAAGLMDRLIIPPNYFLVHDVLRKPGSAARLKNLMGEPWINPYVAGDRRQARGRGRGNILKSLQQNEERPENSDAHVKPAPIIPELPEVRSATGLGAAPIADQVRFCELYFAQPSLPAIRSMLVDVGNKEPEARARAIMRLLRCRGQLTAGRPLRLIHPGEERTVLARAIRAHHENLKRRGRSYTAPG